MNKAQAEGFRHSTAKITWHRSHPLYDHQVPNRTGGLQMTPEELETVGPLLDWMQTRFEWDRDVAVKIVQSRPWLRSGKYSIEDDFDRKIEWFQQRMEVEDADTAALMVGRAVGILRLDHDEIEGKLRGLEEMLDLGSPSVLKMVRDYPRILTESVVDLQRRVRWLEERLQISSTNRKILVCLSPRSLVTSVDKVLEPVVEWAQTELNMNNQKLGVMFLKYPKWLFQVGPGGLSYRLRWLQTALSLSKDDAASLMRREGRLWLLDRVNLWPKLVLFRDSGASPTTLRDEILRSPGILCASLEGRVRVRMAALRQAGILFDFAQHGRIVCCMADKKFSQWMADQEGRGDS